MSPSHKIAIFLLFIPGSQITLDAGWSLTESIIARTNAKWRWVKIARNYCLDFLAFHIADKVILESQNQIRYVSNKFFVNQRKLFSLSTGFDELQLKQETFSSHRDKWKSFRNQNSDFKIITFRGKYNEESGIENLAEASHILSEEKFVFIVVTDKLPPSIDFSVRTIVIEKYIEWDELSEILRISDFYVGQLSFNKRLVNTVPHKAFEAGYFGLPYISAQNSGILETYSSSEAIYISDPIPKEFVAKMRTLSSTEIELYRQAISRKYIEHFSQALLAQRLLEILQTRRSP